MNLAPETPADHTIQYMLSHLGTGQGVGWFSCIPEGDLNFTDIASAIQKHPND